MADTLEDLSRFTAGNYRIDVECHHVDFAGEVVRDLTPYFVQQGSIVERDSCATESALTARLNFIFTDAEILAEFGQATVPWSSMRLRPSITLVSLDTGEASPPTNLGVMLPETPRVVADKYPHEFNVDCHDLIHAIAEPTNGTIQLPGGATIGIEITTFFGEDFAQISAPPAPMQIDAAVFDIATPTRSAREWVIDNDNTWLLIIDQLLESAGWIPPWTNRDGVLTSETWENPADKPIEMVATDDPRTSIIALGAGLKDDTWGVPNEFTFIATDFDPTATTTPVVGDGIVKRSNLNIGPSSQEARGRVVATVMRVDAADQASLEAIADRIFINRITPAKTLCLEVCPQPLPWHRGIVQVTSSDLGIEGETYMIREWSLPLDVDGNDARLVLDRVDGLL